MAQFTFELKQDLFLPATGNPNKGYLYFPKTAFGLSYEVKPFLKKKSLTVLLGVAELATDEICWPLTIYEITENGFPTDEYSNQAAYDTYLSEKVSLETEIESLGLSIDALLTAQEAIEDNTSQEYLTLQAEIDAEYVLLNTKISDLASLVPVHLETLYINKYDDVIEYFKGDGSLTDEGIEWAKTVRYGGTTLGNLIV